MSTLLIEPIVLQTAIQACRTYILLKQGFDEDNVEVNPMNNNSLDRYLRQPYLGLSYDQWHEILSSSLRCNECNFHYQLPFPHRKIGPKDTVRVLQLHFILQGIQRVHECLLSRHYRHNLWIVKAAEGSKGIGIKICDSLLDILAMERDFSSRIVQKYIETPLLLSLHNEEFKFDLRIWVLIASYSPLQVYVYNHIYGRRCSQPYTLDKNQLSNPLIHLTNYSLQKQSAFQSLTSSLKTKFNNFMTSGKESTNLSKCSDDLLLPHDDIINLINRNNDNINSNNNNGTKTWEAFTWPLILSHIRSIVMASSEAAVHRDRSFELLGLCDC